VRHRSSARRAKRGGLFLLLPCQTDDVYSLYLLSCRDKTLYCGIARDLKLRLAQHSSPSSRTKYTRTRLPVKLVYSQTFRTLSAALKAEARVKKLTRKEKLAMITAKKKGNFS